MGDVQPRIMLVVGGLKSELSREEFERRYRERMPRFREIEGLIQKYYAFEEATGEWAGIYLFESEGSLARYLESDLRASIPEAYALTQPPRLERFVIVDSLRPEGGRRGG